MLYHDHMFRVHISVFFVKEEKEKKKVDGVKNVGCTEEVSAGTLQACNRGCGMGAGPRRGMIRGSQECDISEAYNTVCLCKREKGLVKSLYG